jgi:hypothetical protein
LNVSHNASSKKNWDLCWTGWLKKRFLVFTKDKESVINVGKLLYIRLKVLEMNQLSLQAQNMT